MKLFNFEDHEVRVVDIDGEPWWVAADVCRCLEFRRHSSGGYSHNLRGLSSNEKRTLDKGTHDSLSGVFRLTEGRLGLITKSGVFKLIMRSSKPSAKRFRDWVAEVVLPAIEQDGAYVMGEEKVVTGEMSEDELIFKAYTALMAKAERLAIEKAKLEADNKELGEENAAMGKAFGAHDTKVGRFARSFEGLNTQTIKKDLMRLGYLYKAPCGSYRVYRKFAKLFGEAIDMKYATFDIYANEEGKRVIAEHYRKGDLTMLKAYQQAA